jgi:Transcriptional regulators
MESTNKTLEEYIYEILLEEILSLKLRPGMMISIRDISEVYDVGRTPVRDALIHLSKEKLITFLPQRGTMIAKINYEKVKNERFVRKCVEENVMHEFMGISNITAITKLEISIKKQEILADNDDVRGFFLEDMNFHSIFYEYTNRSYCNDMLNAQFGNYNRFNLLSLMHLGIKEQVLSQHKMLLDAILNKDASLMNSIFSQHMYALTNQEKSIINEFLELFDFEQEEVKKSSEALTVDFLVEAKMK